jgi:DNA-binding response OmpR family regulator
MHGERQEEDIRALIQLGLEMQAGWKVLNSNSGEEAIQIAATEQLDAILLDLMMPDMDGKTTLQASIKK